MSQVEIKVNKILIFILIFQFALCLTVTILYGILMYKNGHTLKNIHKTGHPLIVETVVIFFSYYILINSMIPISLIVSM